MKYIISAFILLFSSMANTNGVVKVAVIDSGYDTRNYTFPLCPDGHLDLTDTSFHDERKHGQNISHLIDREIKYKGYCQIIIKIFSNVNPTNTIMASRYVMSFRHILRQRAQFVNISNGGGSGRFLEQQLIRRIINSGTKIIAAAGNDGKDLTKDCFYYPACYDDRIIVVGNKIAKGKRHKSSNYGKQIDVYENGVDQEAGGLIATGTSQATAITTGKLVNKYLMENKND